jgi:hypothetical protein
MGSPVNIPTSMYVSGRTVNMMTCHELLPILGASRICAKQTVYSEQES